MDFSKYSDEELKEKFILLNRNNNLLKSRYCEKCKKDNIRGNFPGIEFWYKGTNKYEGTCEGCFWHNPMAKKQIKNYTELAKMLGISKNQLSIILASKTSPIKSNIEELAKFLNVSPLEILKEVENA